jgi:two-component system chemotaxis response regulator CheY
MIPESAIGVRRNGTPFQVLVIDDSMFIVKQLSQILTSSGFAIAGSAADGEEGLQKYKELYPKVDLVTLDITMPRMDGVTTLGKIMEFDGKANVIMVTALGRQDLVKKALLTGARNYIVKPLDRRKVLERVEMVVRALRNCE